MQKIVCGGVGLTVYLSLLLSTHSVSQDITQPSAIQYFVFSPTLTGFSVSLPESFRDGHVEVV